MQGKAIREALHTGRRVYSTAVVAPTPRWPALLRQAGADFVFIDTEHIPLDRETLSWMCHAFAAQGVPPVTRIPGPDPYEAAKALDGGAGGFIAPYIETADQIRALSAVARYRPLKGDRAEQAMRDPDSLEPELLEYLEKRNGDTIFIANIESIPAIKNLDEILSVAGLDAVLIGPHDLSCSLGVPEQYDHPRFDEAVRMIFSKARAHGVGAGIHFWENIDQEVEWARAGGNLIMHSSDLALFGRNLKRDLDEIREHLAEEKRGGGEEEEVTV